MTPLDVPLADFITAFKALPSGSSEGYYNGQKYGVSIRYGPNEKSAWLYGKALGDTDFVSFNIYFLKDNKTRLKPCEMPAEKVIDFVMNYQLAGDESK